MRELYAGVMSGTSLDGVDCVVADFEPTDRRVCRVLAARHVSFPPSLADELLTLQRQCADELARAARAANRLADLYAESITGAIGDAGLAASDLVAAGVHGQTLRHRPDEGWSIQLNNPARVAETARVTVVADFRSRDIAAGGQGAPLVPAFHAALFAGKAHRVVVNIGGIANITDLPPGDAVRGFDTGPGNVLLDHWYRKHQGGTFDRDGTWARAGRADQTLLEELLGDPYFSLSPPKSTGRDLFNGEWLAPKLAAHPTSAVDVQATLAALTARSIGDAIVAHCATATEVLVCGGGALNGALMDALAARLAPRAVSTTAAALGVPVDHVEALAFAWLARESLAGRPGNLPAVTGARGLRVLGGVYTV